MDYEKLRQEYRPEHISVLLIAESPPKCEPPRFFYDVGTCDKDFLYLEVMSVLFLPGSVGGTRTSADTCNFRNSKEMYLKAFQHHGFWLVDAVPEPLCSASIDSKAKFRKKVQDALPETLCQIMSFNPERGCVIIGKRHSNLVYELLKPELTNKGVQVLNKKTIPLPMCGHQKKFRKQLGVVLRTNGFALPLCCPPSV